MKAYRLKITLKNSKPPIWRRVVIPAGISFSQLTVIIHKAFGWSGYHLSEYYFGSLYVSLVEDSGAPNMLGFSILDSSEHLIDEFFDKVRSFTYTYDLGDDWGHEVKIEETITDYQADFPKVLKYKGETPPEDCGGIWGYYDLMESLSDSKNKDYLENKQWYDENSHGNYNIDEVNDVLGMMRVTEKRSNRYRKRL